jgi:hypothetical protein
MRVGWVAGGPATEDAVGRLMFGNWQGGSSLPRPVSRVRRSSAACKIHPREGALGPMTSEPRAHRRIGSVACARAPQCFRVCASSSHFSGVSFSSAACTSRGCCGFRTVLSQIEGIGVWDPRPAGMRGPGRSPRSGEVAASASVNCPALAFGPPIGTAGHSRLFVNDAGGWFAFRPTARR